MFPGFLLSSWVNDINRVNLTAGSLAALSGKVIGAVRFPVVLTGKKQIFHFDIQS